MNVIKLGKWFIRFVIFLVFIYLVLTAFEWTTFIRIGLELFRTPISIMVIFLAYYLSFLLKAYAWKLYFRGNISLTSSLYGIFYSLFINHLLPLKVGDVVRAMVLSNRETITTEQSFHSVVVLRMLDIICLAMIAGLGMLYYQPVVSIPFYFYFILLLFGVGSVILVRFLFPHFFKRNVKLLMHAFSNLNGLVIFSFVLLSWILEGAVLFGVAMIVFEPLPAIGAIWVNSVTIIGQTFQFTPGGITTYEAIMTYMLTFLQIDAKEGLMLALYSHALKFMFSYLVGLYVYFRYPLTMAQMKKWVQLKGVKKNEKRI
ncbi:lysylphosphatidylglycerol synthase transmembrane domain-containing protein [Halalkalibacter urbisdiaboli]|uniref:lysylphosphatidylglycerol synthase transmembrane domain-containing protein n=1 Tax=Halalkalibacter urbisdiaboli TaxID=1960589 RepID=UPI000B43FF38|nr:lysylphosphatidylglycerol synthase transmembrane domain-containing protein [Halalkalibacter urbisdiaboli]